jgi:hypothetical protein
LTNISVAYANADSRYVSTRVFPVVPVAKQADKYFTYDASYWFRTEANRRAPATESAGGGYELSTSEYFCHPWAFHKDVDDQIRANSDDPLRPDADATRFVTNDLMLRREIDWTSTFFATSTWTGSSSGSDITPSTTWDDASSTPIEDIRKQKRSILEKTGQVANTLVLGAKVFDDLIDHPDIIDRIKHAAGPGNPAIANEQTLGAVLGIPRVLVAQATKNTSAEGATASMDFIVTERHGLLVYVAGSPSLYTPSGGYTFTWTGYLGAAAGAPQISRFRMDAIRADRIEGEMAFDHKVVAADVGVLFKNAVAA